MKELRSVVTAVFLFLVFLFLWSFVVPGYSGEGRSGPRFLRMTVEDKDGSHRHGRPEKISFSVPYSFVRGSLRLAAMGGVRREMDLHFPEEVESERLRSIWSELSEKPDGTEVVRHEHDGRMTFVKQGSMVTLTVHEEQPEVVPEAPEPPEAPEVAEAPEAAEAPRVAEAPEAPATPGAPATAGTPAAEAATEQVTAAVAVPEVKATIRFPARLLEMIASEDRDFDADSLLDLLPQAGKGEILTVDAKDAHVRIWLE